jgi:hypothetical protein
MKYREGSLDSTVGNDLDLERGSCLIRLISSRLHVI